MNNVETIAGGASSAGPPLSREAAWESEEKYRLLFEAIDEGFCIIEMLFDDNHNPTDFRFLEVNPAFVTQTGFKDPVGKRVRELSPPVSPENWFTPLGKVALTGEPRRFENYGVTPHHWYSVYAFRVGWPEQHRVGALFHDVTLRRETEQALRLTEQKLRRALAIETVGVIFFKTDGSLTNANDAFMRMSGFTREDLRAGRMRWDFMTPPEWMKASQKALGEFKSLGRTVPHERQCIRKDGSRWWALVAATRISEDEGVAFVVDITENKLVQQSLAEAGAELQTTNKALESVVEERTAKLQDMMAELHKVSYAMVHDMRAPLRAMRSFAELVDATGDEHTPPEAREYLKRISRAAEQLDHLITDALNYTKVLQEELPMEPVDLQPLVKGLVETYPNLHAHQAEISIGHLPTVEGNKSLLTQLFSSLLENAVKFVPPGAKPEVRVRAEESWAGPDGKPGYVRVWVEDRGIGIPKKAQERVFGIFQKLRTEYPGDGIGLAIVKKAAERMGGNVGVNSEEGKGSRFWVTLPLAQEQQ